MKRVVLIIFFFPVVGLARPELPLLIKHPNVESRCRSIVYELENYPKKKKEGQVFTQSVIVSKVRKKYFVRWVLEGKQEGPSKNHQELLEIANKSLQKFFPPDILQGHEFVSSYKYLSSPYNGKDTWFFEFLVHNSNEMMGAGTPPTVIIPIDVSGKVLASVDVE